MFVETKRLLDDYYVYYRKCTNVSMILYRQNVYQ